MTVGGKAAAGDAAPVPPPPPPANNMEKEQQREQPEQQKRGEQQPASAQEPAEALEDVWAAYICPGQPALWAFARQLLPPPALLAMQTMHPRHVFPLHYPHALPPGMENLRSGVPPAQPAEAAPAAAAAADELQPSSGSSQDGYDEEEEDEETGSFCCCSACCADSYWSSPESERVQGGKKVRACPVLARLRCLLGAQAPQASQRCLMRTLLCFLSADHVARLHPACR